MEVLLTTDPSGARLPRGNVTVLVSPRAAAAWRRHDDVVRVDAVRLVEPLAEAPSPLAAFPFVKQVA